MAEIRPEGTSTLLSPGLRAPGMPDVDMASGLVFGSGSSSLWFFQQTPLTAWPAPDNYVLRYVGFAVLGDCLAVWLVPSSGGARWSARRLWPLPVAIRHRAMCG
jgi:hypothetical protein